MFEYKLSRIKPISEQIGIMNYARAARGKLTRDSILREVDCQSEMELGRHLDSSEKNFLFKRFPPDLIVNRIRQVCLYASNYMSKQS